MLFSNDSGNLIKVFMPHIKEKKRNLNFDKMLLNLYNDILKGDNYVTHQIKRNCFKTHIRGKTELLKSSLLSGEYVPTEIKEYIHKNTIKQLTYRCHIYDHAATRALHRLSRRLCHKE